MGKTFNTGRLGNGLFTDASGNIGVGTTTFSEGTQTAGTLSFIPNSSVSSGPLIQFAGNGRIRPADAGDRLSIDGNALYLNSYIGGNILMNTAGGNVGIGTSSPLAKLHVYQNGTGTYSILRINNDNSTANFHIGVGGSAVPNANLQNNALLWNVGNSAMVFGTNDTERMRIISSGLVGIGTSSPVEKLSINGNILLDVPISSSAYSEIRARYLNDNNCQASIRFYNPDNGFGGEMRFYTQPNTNGAANTERMRITSGGEVQIGSRSLSVTRNTSNEIGVWIKGIGTHSTGYASIQSFATDVTYDTKLVLQENGGRVGIGTTNPMAPLMIASAATGSAIAATNAQQAFDYSRFRIKHYTDSNVGLSIGYAGANYTYLQTGYNEGSTSPLFINPWGGNISIGTTTNTYRLNIAKSSTAAPALMISGAFYGGPRIQTYGLDADGNAWMGLGTDMAGNAYEHSLYYSTNGRQTIGSYDGTTYTTRFYILANGNYWFSGSNLSDVRLKENIQPITLTASEKIALLNPCSYNMKDDLSITKYGFVAQEVQSILPDLIRGGSDKNEDYMGLDYDGIFTITVKAVQEILVRLTALENK